MKSAFFKTCISKFLKLCKTYCRYFHKIFTYLVFFMFNLCFVKLFLYHLYVFSVSSISIIQITSLGEQFGFPYNNYMLGNANICQVLYRVAFNHNLNFLAQFFAKSEDFEKEIKSSFFIYQHGADNKVSNIVSITFFVIQ